MRRLIAGPQPVSPARQRRIAQAVEPLLERRRQALLQRYEIDPQTMLASGQKQNRNSFGEFLALFPTFAEREQELARRAAKDADAEVTAALNVRYSGWRDCLYLRIAEKLLEEMRREDVRVSATYNHRDRRFLASVELKNAKVDLHAETLTVGPTVWSMVGIEPPATSTAPAASLAPADGEAGRGDVQRQFDDELRRRINAKVRGPEGYRDEMLQWAKSNLDVSRDDARALWIGRSGEFPRKAGPHVRRPA